MNMEINRSGIAQGNAGSPFVFSIIQWRMKIDTSQSVNADCFQKEINQQTPEVNMRIRRRRVSSSTTRGTERDGKVKRAAEGSKYQDNVL